MQSLTTESPISSLYYGNCYVAMYVKSSAEEALIRELDFFCTESDNLKQYVLLEDIFTAEKLDLDEAFSDCGRFIWYIYMTFHALWLL
jgi:hypothetical protein